jgi:hypothetical protein
VLDGGEVVVLSRVIWVGVIRKRLFEAEHGDQEMSQADFWDNQADNTANAKALEQMVVRILEEQQVGQF